jgi:hypothetical protein
VRDETAVIYEAYIPHDSLQNNISEYTRYLPLLYYCTKVIYTRTNTENEHAQYELLPGTRKNADMTTHPVEGSEVI